jgi:hypothetical protein
MSCLVTLTRPTFCPEKRSNSSPENSYAFRGWDDRSVNPLLGGIAQRDQITESMV